LMLGSIANCEVKDPVKRVAQALESALLFEQFCGKFNISYPMDSEFLACLFVGLFICLHYLNSFRYK